MAEKIEIIIEGQDKGANAALGKLQNNLREVGDGSKTASGGLTQMIGTVGTITGAVGLAGVALSQMYAQISQGAELELAAQRFDNLAASIGTTADALINDLGAATGGMMSNADMIASASQIISLGLATNQQDVVDLASLVSQLGWDMQQVIMTFANNSKMRLDALGLSVTDVEARMADLEAQGYNTDKAFDMAIIQAGQAKLELLGSAAGTNAGKMKVAEAQIENFTNALKQKLVPIVGEAAGAFATLITWQDQLDAAMTEHNQEVADTSATYDDYIAEMQRAAEAAGMQLVVTDELTEAEAATMGAVVGMTEAQWDANQAMLTAEEYGSNLAQTASEYLVPSQEDAALAADKVAAAHQAQATAAAQANTQSTLLADAVANMVAGFDPAATAASVLADGIQTITDSAVEAERITLLFAIAQKTAELNSQTLSDAERAQASAELELMLNQQSQLENLDMLNQLVADGAITKYDWIAAMADQIVTTEELNTLMGIENETLAENEEAAFLAEQATRKQTDAINGLVEDAPSAITAMQNLAIAADAAAGDYSIHFNITSSGTIPAVGGGGAPSDKPGSSQEMATGGIVPGVFSQPVPMVVHGSEMILNPQQQASLFALLNGGGGGMGSRELAPVVQVYLDSEPIVARVIARASERGRLGAAAGIGSAGR